MRLRTNRIDHIVHAVRRENLDEYVRRAAALFHADFEFLHGPDITGIGLDSYISWETGLDYVSPLDSDAPLSRSVQDFLDQKGEGVWGIVIGVEEIEASVVAANTLGYPDAAVSLALDPEARRARARTWTRKVSDLQQVWIGAFAGTQVYLSEIHYADGVL